MRVQTAVQPSFILRHWKALCAINLILGGLLWFDLCTDYAWSNVWFELLFAPLIGLIGTRSWLLLRNADRNSAHRIHGRVTMLSCFPAIAGGLPNLFLIVLMFCSPFTLGALFWIDEQSRKVEIQEAVSPDGSKIAEVYFVGVGAYDGGTGRIEVHLTYPNLPFVYRDVYSLSRSDLYPVVDTVDYLEWRDSDTFFVSEERMEIDVGNVSWETPIILHIPILVFEQLIRLF